MKFHQGPVFTNDMENSSEGVDNSKMNFVKVVQNQLFQKLLKLCANFYYKIVMRPLARWRQLKSSTRPAYIQCCLSTWLLKKALQVGWPTICRRSIKSSFPVVEKNVKKSTISVLRNVMNRCTLIPKYKWQPSYSYIHTLAYFEWVAWIYIFIHKITVHNNKCVQLFGGGTEICSNVCFLPAFGQKEICT